MRRAGAPSAGVVLNRGLRGGAEPEMKKWH
jgi:hypothetical protein